MDLFVAPTAPLLVSRPPADRGRRRPSDDGLHPPEPSSNVTPLSEELFDSAAPVAVGATTEAAVADLRPMAALPLAEAIHRYVDET